MTWLDIGNGWRNIYLLSCILQACALGALFAVRRWFAPKSRAACFLTGVSATPFLQYLWMLAMALAWPSAPRLVYIAVPPLTAVLCLGVIVLRRVKRLKELICRAWRFLRRAAHFEKPALVALCVALCLLILILPVCVRFCSSMVSMGGGDAGEYMGLALRYCEDRQLGELLEKDDQTGHFRGHSHFPSLELFMSYGLFHTGGELGYPCDKAAFAGLGMLCFYMLAGCFALLLLFCRERKQWILLGAVLLNLVPNLYDAVATAPRDIWRIIAVFLAILVFAGLEPRGRNWKHCAGKLVLSFAVCFTVMSAHVVCFVVLPFIVAAWVVWRWLEALLRTDGTAPRTLLASIGVALAGGAGTLVGFSGNLWCYWKWGELSPWRLMTTFTDAPWYDVYMDIEYRLDLVMTHLNFFKDYDSILRGYATPVGVWGLITALAALAVVLGLVLNRRTRYRKALRTSALQDGPTGVILHMPRAAFEQVSAILFCALLTLMTFAPISGLIDSKLYCFSSSFVKLPRYTLQWRILDCVMICAVLSALGGLWSALMDKAVARRAEKASAEPADEEVPTRLSKLRSCENAVWRAVVSPYARRLPACLCALLCVLSFVQGTRQTGYAESFYRSSRNVMEDESILLDNGFRDIYTPLMNLAEHVGEEQKILITRVGYQYALRAKGYVLTTNPFAEILNMRLEEIEPALREKNVAAIATQPEFWDKRYFVLTTLNEYLNTLPPEQVIETENMRLYLLDPSLAACFADETLTE